MLAGIATSSSTHAKTSGIYFIDDDETEHFFRTTGITGRGQLFEHSPDALPEMQWLYNVVQTYLKNISTPSLPQDVVRFDTKTADINAQ